ncbi:MAG TPA: RusA family crossover junction endodeoxyribonuclease [Candidatus Nitrosocosmicus sp.]|nr:RusA family crossover junction endodeoxyribonuclease [Candidatus Nitrosocosmicus sp.]
MDNRNEWSISVLGEPKAQPRVKARAYMPKYGGKMRAMVYTPSSSEEWARLVEIEAIRNKIPTIETAITAILTFVMPRPKYLTKDKDFIYIMPHTKRPDCDNLAKLIFDRLKDTKIIKDDSQIWKTEITKRYVDKDELPRCEIKLIYYSGIYY